MNNNASTVWDTIGHKQYELNNHLGNVLTTISDKRIAHSTNGTTVDYYNPEIYTAQDYFAFGWQIPKRNFTLKATYRYGFNGKENDNEVKLDPNGNPIVGAEQDYGMRILDNRVGRFLSVDPLTVSYPFYTPYSFSGNNPIKFIDLDGEEEYDPTQDPFFALKLVVTTIYDVAHSAENLVFKVFVPNDPGKKWLATYKIENGHQTMETAFLQVPKQGAAREILNTGLDAANIFLVGKGFSSNSFDASLLFAETSGETQLTKAIKEGVNIERAVVRLNQEAGYVREAEEFASLKTKNPSAAVQKEQYLRTDEGKIARDPLTGEARRIDFAVIENGKVKKLVETTSLTANKTRQSLKEKRIRAAGGTYILDRTTRKLVDISKVKTVIIRRK